MKYKNGVRHWLIKEFHWGKEKAKSWVNMNSNYLEIMRAEGSPPFETANLINKMKKE